MRFGCVEISVENSEFEPFPEVDFRNEKVFAVTPSSEFIVRVTVRARLPAFGSSRKFECILYIDGTWVGYWIRLEITSTSNGVASVIFAGLDVSDGYLRRFVFDCPRMNTISTSTTLSSTLGTIRVIVFEAEIDPSNIIVNDLSPEYNELPPAELSGAIKFWKQASVCTRLGSTIPCESYKPCEKWFDVEPPNKSDCIWMQFGVPLSSPPLLQDEDSGHITPIADVSMHYHSAGAIDMMKQMDERSEETKAHPLLHDDDSSSTTSRKRKRETVLIDLT